MHKEEDITIDNLCKIEGEASLDIKIRNNKIEKAELKITQNKRFYTESIMGKMYSVVPPSVSRICGTCSTSHVLASIKAIENAYNIEVSKQTKILRELAMHGQLIRDHAMHLYLFVLPVVFMIEIDIPPTIFFNTRHPIFFRNINAYSRVIFFHF